MTDSEPSYIDYETFLDPDFSPTSFANSLVLATNNPSDTPLDLSTPLSRVLFDVQDVDTHIHTLTTKSALPLLNYTKDQDDAGQRIVSEVETQVANLTEGYQRLQKEVIQRYEAADEIRLAVERLWQTVKIGRGVGRCLLLGRQLEAQMGEVGTGGAAKKEDHRAMIRAANTLLSIRQVLAASGPGDEGEHLLRINLISSLQSGLLASSDSNLQNRGQQIIREFSMSSLAPSPSGPATYAQSEETKARTISALVTLHLLSPQLLLSALQSYLRTSLTSSLASIARALANLPSLDRTLLEVSARCQNIVALEALLETVKAPSHPTNQTQSGGSELSNFLQPLLAALDTSSLPSYFWRSLAEGLAGRVSDLVARGGVNARTLRSQKDRVRESIRDCVFRGSQGPGGARGREGAWEREAAVMVGSVIGALAR
ncbi:Golgi transport complex subunit 5-domain-containing protein [Usnea florida]